MCAARTIIIHHTYCSRYSATRTAIRIPMKKQGSPSSSEISQRRLCQDLILPISSIYQPVNFILISQKRRRIRLSCSRRKAPSGRQDHGSGRGDDRKRFQRSWTITARPSFAPDDEVSIFLQFGLISCQNHVRVCSKFQSSLSRRIRCGHVCTARSVANKLTLHTLFKPLVYYIYFTMAVI